MRRLIAPMLISATLVTTVLMAPPSTAATVPVTNANCTSFSPPRSIVGAPGDLVDVSANLTGCRSVTVKKSIVSALSDIVVTSASSVTVLDPPGADYWVFDPGPGNQISRVQITLGSTLGTTSRAIVVSEDAGPIETQWTVTISADGGGGSSSGSASSSAPAPIFQQFGKPSSGTCDAAAPATLNWSGVTSGGWSESWAQWMNGGNGGAVCTRALVYSTAQSRWVVG